MITRAFIILFGASRCLQSGSGICRGRGRDSASATKHQKYDSNWITTPLSVIDPFRQIVMEIIPNASFSATNIARSEKIAASAAL